LVPIRVSYAFKSAAAGIFRRCHSTLRQWRVRNAQFSPNSSGATANPSAGLRPWPDAKFRSAAQSPHHQGPVFRRGEGRRPVQSGLEHPGPRPRDAWSNYLPDSKGLEADWFTRKCGTYNKSTKSAKRRRNAKQRASVIEIPANAPPPAGDPSGEKPYGLQPASTWNGSSRTFRFENRRSEPTFHFAPGEINVRLDKSRAVARQLTTGYLF
jgi:hypothetical protein